MAEEEATKEPKKQPGFALVRDIDPATIVAAEAKNGKRPSTVDIEGKSYPVWLWHPRKSVLQSAADRVNASRHKERAARNALLAKMGDLPSDDREEAEAELPEPSPMQPKGKGKR